MCLKTLLKSQARPGDVILFKGEGPLFEILSRLLKLFEPGWNRYGWHMAFVAWDSEDGLVICEALANGVCLNPLNKQREYRVYRWLDTEPPRYMIMDFVKHHLNEKYDVLLYPWTAAFYLFRHFWNKPIPRLLDNAWTCWELVCEFANEMGKPIISVYDCPVITDILRNFGELS